MFSVPIEIAHMPVCSVNICKEIHDSFFAALEIARKLN